MAYFPNGTAGDMYRERYCDKCKHDKDDKCPIWLAHLLHNYDECNNDDSILHMLIPMTKDGLRATECFFYETETMPLPGIPE